MKTHCHPSLLPRLNFAPYFFISSPPAAQGDGEWGLSSQFITHCPCHFFLLRRQQGHSSASHGLHRLQGTPAPLPGAPPPTPSVLQGSSTHSHSSFQLLRSSSPLLKSVIPEAAPPSLVVGSALASTRSVLAAEGIGFIRHGGTFWKLLTADTSAAPLLLGSCHSSQIQWIK